MPDKISVPEKKTEHNFDLLRVVCTMAVVVLHVSATYVEAYVDSAEPYQTNILATMIFNTVTRFAVPCFMMLSGAFLLDNDENRDYKIFYRKSMKKIGYPILIFSAVYFVYYMFIVTAHFYREGGDYSVLFKPLLDTLKGEPFYHMWYLFTLIGIYILVPVLIKIKLDIGEKAFAKVCWIYFIVAMISGYTTSAKLDWSVSKVVVYLGFFLAGYRIRKMTLDHKGALKGVFFIALSVGLLLVLTYIQYPGLMSGTPDQKAISALVGYFHPLVVISSVLFFTGFSCFSGKNSGLLLHRLSKNTFILYLFHAGVWHLMSTVLFKLMGITPDPIYAIPAGTVVTFLISWGGAVIYNKIWGQSP